MKAISRPDSSAHETRTSELSPLPGIPYSQNQIWENWGRTARCQPELSFYPQGLEDLIQIVDFARERGKKVRVSASGHSWSALVPTDGILVFVHHLNKVIEEKPNHRELRERIGNMKLVYAVSQRRNPKRPTARHIDNGAGKPLCGGNGREPFFWAPEEGEPTCKICMDLALMLQEEPEKSNAKPVS